MRTARVGLASGEIERLSTRVVSVKAVPEGQGVSYGYTYTTAHPTRLALVPLGYGDGIPRRQVGAQLTIAGHRLPIAGRVAMDQVVVDVGDLPIAAGDEVIAWGEGGASVAEWCAWTGLSPAGLTAPIGVRTRIELVAEPATPDDMAALGARLAAVLVAGDAVILTGPLGAGKTTLTRGLGRALGARGTVSSPTFVLARTHSTASAPLLHVDAYRVAGSDELWDLDLDLDGSITVAEWGQPLTDQLSSWLDVTIERPTGSGPALGTVGSAEDEMRDLDAPTPRAVTITGFGPAWPRERMLALTGVTA